MLKDITLGQYYQTDSVIHRLDPRVKLVTTICFIISLFVVDNLVGYVLAGVFLVLVVDRISAYYGSGLQSFPDTGRAACYHLEADDHEGRCDPGRENGGQTGIPDHRLIGDDTDNHTQSAYGRSGKAVKAIKCHPGTGA